MLELKNITVNLGDFSLEKISFRVNRGDYFILLGVSGAGKSMLLETIAGLTHPSNGTIILNGKDITKEKIHARNIGLVFQDHAVFPHLTVWENIMYALHKSHLSREGRKRQVEKIAEELNILNLLDRKPYTLSGGELQRVALGRTLVQKPGILLLDEPLSSLDSQLKKDLRRLLRMIHRNGQTILHVTHDYEEAISLATRIAVINEGTIIQEGTTSEVLHHPRSEFVAHFVGIKNFFTAKTILRDDRLYAVSENNIPFRILGAEAGEEGFILIRGEDILLSCEPVETSATNTFKGTITEIVASASGTDVTMDAGIELHALVTPESVRKMELKEGRTCWAHVKATAVRFIRS